MSSPDACSLIIFRSPATFRSSIILKPKAYLTLSQQQHKISTLSSLSSQDAGACRFLAVCARCSTDCKGESSGVVVADPAAVPVCDEVPTGARSAEDGGTTLETLELEPGYYRTSNKSHDVLECFQEAACKGGVDAADDGYCAEGYSGPCESLSVVFNAPSLA